MELFSAKVNFKYSLNQQIHTKNTGLWVRIPLITHILTHNVLNSWCFNCSTLCTWKCKEKPSTNRDSYWQNRDSNSPPIDYESCMITITPQWLTEEGTVKEQHTVLQGYSQHMTIKTHVWINNVSFFKIIKVFMFQKFQLWAEIKQLLTFSSQRKSKTHNLYSCQTIQQSNSKDQAVRTRTLTAGLNYRDTPLSQVRKLLRTCNWPATWRSRTWHTRANRGSNLCRSVSGPPTSHVAGRVT